MTRDQRSGVNGCGVTRDPPSPLTLYLPFPHPERLREEVRVCEVVKVYTPLKKHQESLLKEIRTGKRGWSNKSAGNTAL